MSLLYAALDSRIANGKRGILSALTCIREVLISSRDVFTGMLSGVKCVYEG